jgi:Domain of unknown function (DUF4331)
MSNHFSAAMLKFPGDDPRLDVIDLFVFASPQVLGRTVLIVDVNPFMTGADFHPGDIYRINVDTDADVQADAAFSFVFSESNDGTQTATVQYATGSQARETEPAGEVLIEGAPVGFDAMATPVQAGPCRLFTGVRSDPFFADGEGAFHDFQFTGDDTFAGKNVLSMALEIPNDMLGAGPEIGVWGTVSVRREGTLVQVDRIGNASFNPFFVDGLKNEFNPGHQADDVASFVVPLTGDVYDMHMAFLTHGGVTSDGVGPHDDYLTEFPFVGRPNAQRQGEPATGLLSAA